jgi:hypothetical protein
MAGKTPGSFPLPRRLRRLSQMPSGNQQQAEYKNPREDQNDQKANIRMRRPRQEDVIEPEGNGGKRRARRDRGARKGHVILSQKVDGLQPVSQAFLQIHRNRFSLPSMRRWVETLLSRPRIIRRAGQSP